MKSIAGYEMAMDVITNRSSNSGSSIKRSGSDSDAFQVKMTFKKISDVPAIPYELHFQAGRESRVEKFLENLGFVGEQEEKLVFAGQVKLAPEANQLTVALVVNDQIVDTAAFELKN